VEKNNLSSPERTCVVCRKKNEKNNLVRLCQKATGEYFFDKSKTYQSRGYYICKDSNCVERLSKHKKIKISFEELYSILDYLKKEEKDYLNILRAMKNSEFLAFGINMVLEEIKKVSFIIMASDVDERPKDVLLKKIEEYNIKYIYYSTKDELGKIFGKSEVNVVAVKNKRIAKGLI